MRLLSKKIVAEKSIYIILEAENDFHFPFIVNIVAHTPSYMVCMIDGDDCKICFIIRNDMLISNSVNRTSKEFMTYYEQAVFHNLSPLINNSLTDLSQMVVQKWMI